jgi:segregation and condensation protein B
MSEEAINNDEVPFVEEELEEECAAEKPAFGENLRILEALIFASDEYLTAARLKAILPGNPGARGISAMIEKINRQLQKERHPFEIVEIGGGYQFKTVAYYHPWVRQIFQEKAAKRLSIQALECLSIIAYRQPLSKAEIEAIRGVISDGAMKTLLEKRLITITGRSEKPGRPLLYGTTPDFLKYFGLNSTGDLPNIEEFEAMVRQKIESLPIEELGSARARVLAQSESSVAGLDAESFPIEANETIMADETTLNPEPGKGIGVTDEAREEDIKPTAARVLTEKTETDAAAGETENDYALPNGKNEPIVENAAAEETQAIQQEPEPIEADKTTVGMEPSSDPSAESGIEAPAIAGEVDATEVVINVIESSGQEFIEEITLGDESVIIEEITVGDGRGMTVSEGETEKNEIEGRQEEEKGEG